MEAPLAWPHTLSILKHVTLDPPHRNNGPFLEERSHLGGGVGGGLMVVAGEGQLRRLRNRHPTVCRPSRLPHALLLQP